jgi:hypothetical protein
MNYKTSILSLAAVVALNSALFADPYASYLPLTNKVNDNAWIMFGVNNFSDGIKTTGGTDGIFTGGYTIVSEADVSDDLSTGGFLDATNTYDMASFQALKDSNANPYFTSSVELALKSNDLTYHETQPVRSMYIAIRESTTDTNSISKIKLNYRAVLEGREIEIRLGGSGAIYRTTISQTNTYNNPAIAANTVSVVTGDLMDTPEEALAYDLSASPILAASYSKADHQGAVAGNERFYNYDAANGNWKIWDRSAKGTDTITTFEKGKAYWGRMDINADAATTSTTRAGLVLGKTTNSTADASVYTDKLVANAWNMLAFDPAQNPDIRNAATGLIVTKNALADGDQITILDETGVNAIVITFAAANDISLHINSTIEAAKNLGNLPHSFNIKAMAIDANTNIAFLSDKKFTIQDTTGDCLAGVKTVANNDVINFDGSIAAVADIGTGADQANTAATSVYGEYMMVVEPIVADGASAADLDSEIADGSGAGLSAKVQFGNLDGDSSTALALAANDTDAEIATAQPILTTDEVFNGTKGTGRALEIDSNFDGTNNMLLLAADKPFYIKDATYTRIYDIDTSATGTDEATNANVAYTIKNTTTTTLTPADDDAVAAFVTAINAQADDGAGAGADTLTYASVDGTKLVIVTTDSEVFALEDADSELKDYFTPTNSTADVAKGAIKRVISVADLAREAVITNKVEITFTADAGAAETESDLAVDTVVGGVVVNPAATTIAAEARTDTTIITMLDSLVLELNSALKTANVPAFASHNYVSGTNDITKAVITLEGVAIGTTTLTEADGTALAATIADANSATAGKLNLDGAAIVADLKANAVYTPDYVNYGPLYTLKEAGFKAEAIIRPSTKLANAPTTHWDHIDLTRDSQDWLKHNEYNLFSVDNASGYWVYLVENTDAVTIETSNTIYTPTFRYHFNPIDNATNSIIESATFTTEIANADAATSNAKLVIGGEEIQLTNTGSTYTAKINEYQAPMDASTVTIGIRIADGLGNRLDNPDFLSVDYEKPATPTVDFISAMKANIVSTSVDVASYYIWKNFIPDDVQSPTKAALAPADAATYNMCHDTAYASSTDYKIVAIDNDLFKGSFSDATPVTVVNTLKSATVLTHSNGDAASSVVVYDSSCEVDSTLTGKSGVEVYAEQTGTVRLAFQHKSGTADATAAVPMTAYYDVPTAVGTAVVRIDADDRYTNDTLYVQYAGKLYTGSFPTDRDEADGSFTTPLNLSDVTSSNQRLD